MEAIINGSRIVYHRTGRGAPLILVHGITTYSFIWEGIVPGLADKFDVISLDLLGCGESEKPTNSDISPLIQAAIVRGLMDHLGIERAHMVTHDIGGAIGQIMAATHPDRISSLVLINTVGYDYWPVQPIITFRIPIVRQLAMAVLDKSLFRRLIERGVYRKERVTDELMDVFYKPLQTREGRQGFINLARSLDNSQIMSIIEQIHAIKSPVMIVRGDADVYLTQKIAESLHENIKGSRLERSATGGHFIQLDEPGWLVKIIANFCGGVK